MTSSSPIDKTFVHPTPLLKMQNDLSSESFKLGFYGGGMMAEAIIKALLKEEIVPPSRIYVCEISQQRRTLLEGLGLHVSSDPAEMLQKSKVLIIAVKPDLVPLVCNELKSHHFDFDPASEKLVISICAGVTLDQISFGNPDRKCIRVMPNQPCLVGEAASAFALSPNCQDADRRKVELLMGACGLVLEVQEKFLDAVTGLSGSGPGFVFMMMEAMTDAGVRNGLPRPIARKLAVQTVRGTAKMALEFDNTHLAELRNRVESPGGTTIAGTSALESGRFRASIIEAISCATSRSEQLGKKN